MDRIEKLKEMLKQQPEDSFLKHALALEYIKAGDVDKAEALFEEILANDPEYVGSYYQLGKLLENKGMQERALEVYERGIEMTAQKKETHAMNELRSAYDELMEE